VEEAGKAAAGVRRAYDAACRSTGKPAVYTGRVTKIEDAKDLLRLDNRLFALPQGSRVERLAEGGQARIVARRLDSGPALVQSAVGLDVTNTKPSPPTVGNLPCVSLLFAPPQDWTKPTPILHPTLGYVANNLYRLEEGVRYAATPECPAGQSARFSLRVVFTAPGELTKTIADLTSDDGPVPVPITGGAKTWTITVTERKQSVGSCEPGNQPQPHALARSAQTSAGRIPLSVGKAYPCPVVDVRTTTYQAKVRPPGWYATALYDRDVLAVNENGFDATEVFVVGINDSSAFGANFEAQGYGATGTDPPFAFKTIHKDQPFGVRPDNWYSIYWYSNVPSFLLHHMGVDHFAGLIWPRIVGTRHASPFRYRVKLPTIVKDLLPSCGGGENCFFRLPWAAGSSEKTTQGNNQPASHNGNQAYAFDFVHEDGETIYATRGGIVGDIVESLTMNCVPPADCPANYVRVDHQDDTYSWYAHVQTNSVIPTKGQKVIRGQAIALVGNVGRSTSSHLHYQVSIDNTNTIYAQTIPICFEAIWFDVDTGDPVITPCYVPVTGYFTQSTNG
jgi:murein DD-endopeptidase MepM/ murein hydrolase activator NlpD